MKRKGVADLLAALLAVICILCALSSAHAEQLCVMVVQARGGLNVRAAPGKEAGIVYLLDDCETVVVLEWRDGWALVAKNIPPHAKLGWVCGDYLK